VTAEEKKDTVAEEVPLPPRRKKKKGKRKAEAARQQALPAEVPPKKSRGRVWAIALLAAAVFELWLFGRRGHLEVCVARDGEHDFALLGQPRTEENTRRYPTCEKRFNLGVTSHYDEAVEDGMLHACRRANILRGREAILLCALKEGGWQHRVEESWCPPWHDHYYKRLFWFAFGD
jgi:hypothetical protein